MLTGDLLRVKLQRHTVSPTWIDPGDEALLEIAGELHAAFVGAAEERWKRGQLDEAVTAIIGDNRSVKTLRGLAKLLSDRSTFEVQAPLPPSELRSRVFRKAREMGPLALEAGPLERTVADDVLKAIAAELDCTPDLVSDALYADLKQEQRITGCDVPSPTWLLHRYNVALVQALLLRASGVTLTLERTSQPRLRQLFRYVKFHQLVHHAKAVPDGLVVTLDGPMSMFSQSTKYGMKLATFFPAVLLQEGSWTLEARILWGKRKLEKTLTVSSADGLVSHYADRGAYVTREQTWFAERWQALDTDWKMEEGRTPIDLGGRSVVLPDFTFRKGRKRAHLEIVGFWRRDWLDRRLDLLRRFGPGNLILAVSKRLAGEKKADLDALGLEVIPFAEIVPPKKVLAAVEAVAKTR